MPKTRAAATIGRSQAGRPPAPIGTPQQAEGPRTLHGALVLPIEQIVPDPDQPRTSQDTGRLEELASSLQDYGVLQPLLVREDGFLDDGRVRYMIIAGGRRYAAAQIAGLTRLPVVVRDSAGAMLRLTQLVENIQRQDLTALEEARAYKELLDAEEGLTPETLGKRLHISGQTIRDRLKVLADQVFADAVQRQQIAATTARRIMMLPDEAVATLRAQVVAGERVTNTDVEEARRRTQAAGATNPRRKGGGRVVRSSTEPAQQHGHDQNSFDRPTIALPDQNSFDRPRASTTQQQAPRMIAEHELEVVSLLRTGGGQAPRDEVVAALARDLEHLR